MYAIGKNTILDGTVRESFFYNQVANVHKVSVSQHADFLIDGKLTFEIGGKNKTRKQLKNLSNS